jgi:hypothetical protein
MKATLRGAEEVRNSLAVTIPMRVRFAMLKALDRTTDKTKARLYSEMHRVFDRPTPYTLNALRSRPPRMDNMTAEVGFKEPWAPRSTKYLEPQVEGGPRRRKGFEQAMSTFGVRGFGMRGIRDVLMSNEYLIPARGVALNQFGNVSPGLIQKILAGLQAQPDALANTTTASRKRKKSNEWYFFTKGGIWQRKGRKVTLLFFRTSKAPMYKKRFPFYELADQFAAETLTSESVLAVREAVEDGA